MSELIKETVIFRLSICDSMATIKYLLKGSGNPSTILVRFTNGRKHDFKRSTSIQCNPKHWNQEKGEFRKVSTPEERDKKNNQLQGLRSFILDSYNEDYSKGLIISSEWLNQTIRKYFNQEEETDLNLLHSYGEYFIKNLPTRKNTAKGGKIGVAESTIKKYRSVLRKIGRYEKHLKRKIYLREVNLKFEKDFINYLMEVEKYNENYTGRLITFVKTICKEAKSDGIKTHPELDKIKGFNKKVKFVYLNEEEIEKIYEYDFKKTPYLDNARDWLIVGLYSGQRVSDFMSFNPSTVKNEFLDFIQQKTGKQTIVPIHPRVQMIIDKYNGQFPRQISEQKFNEYIKTVCEKVGLTEMVEGSKMDKDTKRKVFGKFPKHELISSHVCRRSFATNHYGKLPTGVLMSITNHSTEKMFLNYIGKTREDHAEQLRKYWEEIQTIRTPLSINKSAS